MLSQALRSLQALRPKNQPRHLVPASASRLLLSSTSTFHSISSPIMSNSDSSSAAVGNAGSSSGMTPERAAVITKLRGIIQDGSDSSTWDSAWSKGLTPWDSQPSPQPSLVSSLEKDQRIRQHLGALLEPAQGSQVKAVIAGCGRGYDAEYLARAHAMSATGVDISATAVAKAKEWLLSQPPHPSHAKVEFVEADFFALGTADKSSFAEAFDLAYDYTFFCALNPSLHAKWAASYERIVKPGGYLFCVVYPIQGDRPGGPPYSVAPAQYKELLGKSFELLAHVEDPLELREGHEGIEQIMLWRRR